MVAPNKIKEDINNILERAKYETIALVCSQQEVEVDSLTLTPEWMTALQLAEYWQIHNKDGKPTIAGIMKWAKRPLDKNPLPHGYMGDLMRFHRDEVNQWAKEEAERRRSSSERKRFTIAG